MKNMAHKAPGLSSIRPFEKTTDSYWRLIDGTLPQAEFNTSLSNG